MPLGDTTRHNVGIKHKKQQNEGTKIKCSVEDGTVPITFTTVSLPRPAFTGDQCFSPFLLKLPLFNILARVNEKDIYNN